MFEVIISDDKFRSIMKKHCYETVKYLKESRNFFSFFCYIHQANFIPKLPTELENSLKHLTLFSMNGYTFDSIKITEDFLEFEAGFGENNFTSIVKVPLNSILQMTVEDNVIFVNSGSSIDKKEDKKSLRKEISSSIDAILSNPRNKNLRNMTK